MFIIAIGFYGRLAQYGSAAVAILLVVSLLFTWLFRHDYPRATKKIRKYAIAFLILLPCTYAALVILAGILYGLSGLFN
ncbi:MAG: hypothetical protein JWL85_196 [Candidatus Saccharibacteria bacterium]|nr:hypothetical protein [Candidatus Saccharibacteria bacterium]